MLSMFFMFLFFLNVKFNFKSIITLNYSCSFKVLNFEVQFLALVAFKAL